ncbi:hypothetical protein ACFQ0D_36175, partial [Micromonospora zhanjiangensis]
IVLTRNDPDRSGSPLTAPAAACPRLPTNRAFTGVTYGSGAQVRSGATIEDPVVATVPSDCTLGFTGFCLGERVHDPTGGTPDIRWFITGDGNVVASAVVHGNPPATLAPARCRHDRPAPSAVSLVLAPGPAGGVTATADGRDVDIVGFAAWQVPDPVSRGPVRWRQLTLTEGPAFHAAWQPDQRSAPGGQVLVAAVACLGGGRPTTVLDLQAMRLGGGHRDRADPERPRPVGQSAHRTGGGLPAAS